MLTAVLVLCVAAAHNRCVLCRHSAAQRANHRSV